MKKFSLPFLIIILCTGSAFAQLTAPAPQILIPAAGSVQGLNGTFFRSDIAVFNYRDVPQDVLLEWLPQGTSGVGGPSVLITINARSGIISQDFVTVFLHQSGLGAILMSAMTSGSLAEANGALFATARIWTPQAD